MALPHLIRYVLLFANRQSTVNISLITLATVFLFSLGFLIVDAGGVVPAAEMQCAEGDDCEFVQYAEQEPGKEQTESRGSVQEQRSVEALNGDAALSTLVRQFPVRMTQLAE